MSLASRFDETIPATPDDLDTIIVPRARDLGSFEVRRSLPHAHRQMVGPFIFFDQMGPADFHPGKGMDVRPHPHIGLATVTYLYEGTIRHKDSLGSNIDITPGALNFMVAGKGITHSERTPPEVRAGGHKISGLQTWVALPKSAEETDPSFEHVPADKLPVLTDKGIEMNVILGSAYGAAAPAKVYSETLYVDVHLAPNTALPLPNDHEDRALYVIKGSVFVANDEVPPGQLVIFKSGRSVSVKAGEQGATMLLCGGEVADGPRHIWWNFVASSKEKIAAAKEEWKAADWGKGRFDLPPDDRDEFIPIED